MSSRRQAISLGLTALASGAAPAPAPVPPILDYIKQTWTALTRTPQNLALAAADPKFPPAADGRWPVYVPPGEDIASIERDLRTVMAPADFAKIELRVLPPDFTGARQHGLLWLPRPWVVPGGRFNEMYGWDSFFIQMGLLRDGEFQLAKDLADNALFEIRNYGKILNANRTYYLTRSQPPFLTQMLLAVHQTTQDSKWLDDSLPAIRRYYDYWTTEPHLTPATGLSRYYDSGTGPAPEVVSSELDSKGRTDYDLITRYFHTHYSPASHIRRFYDPATGALTPLFYQGDRSMRESGFDPSSRFGPFGADVISYNPVCLNSLLYLMESQTADILVILGKPGDAEPWRQRAARRATKINSLMWDARHGLYFDYHFAEGHRRSYPFLSTFYPLWAGIADPAQAARVVRNLAMFERRGGLQTSTFVSGDQWDAPFGWAPLHWIAVQGLRRYGFNAEADRVSLRFLSLIHSRYRKRGVIVEKYDVSHGLDTGRGLLFGYHSNEFGFGWTNAVFTALYDQLDPRLQQHLLR